MLRRRIIFLLVTVITVHLLEHHCKTIPTLIAQSSTRGTEWELDTGSGVPLWIGMNSRDHDYLACRHIFVFIEPGDFNVRNLRRAFLYLSEKYLQPEFLRITVRSDKTNLQKWIDHYRAFYSIPPDSYIERNTYAEVIELRVYEETKVGCYRAEYVRFRDCESFNYSPDPDKEDLIGRELRCNKSFGSTGDLSSDLVRASRDGLDEQIKKLLDMGADINARDKHGNTPLIAAALKGDSNIVKLLLDKGADVNLKDSDGWSPLMCAIILGHDHIVEELLIRGADVNAENDAGQTVLTIAAARSSNEIIVELLRKGADVNVKDKYGRTPVMIAEEHRRFGVVNLLKDTKAQR